MANITVADAYELLKTDCRVHNRIIKIGDDDITIPFEQSLAYDALKDYLVESISYNEYAKGDGSAYYGGAYSGWYDLGLKIRYCKSGTSLC